MNILHYLLVLLIPCSLGLPNSDPQSIEKGGMKVTWEHVAERIHFEMEAPSAGWLAIGFNTRDQLAGTYLLMGAVKSGKTEVFEHYTKKPGTYPNFAEMGLESSVAQVMGEERRAYSRISFSLPVKAGNRYARDLSPGQTYYLLLAYSREDEFEHHSAMRTSVKITL